MRKELGKIKSARFGFTGYQEAMFGLFVDLGGASGWCVMDTITGFWNESIQVTEFTKWTEDDRSLARVEMIKKVDKILLDAKVSFVDELINKPVECEFDGMKLNNWRILTEVI